MAREKDKNLDLILQVGEVNDSYDLKRIQKMADTRQKKNHIFIKRKLIDDKSDLGHFGTGPGSYNWEKQRDYNSSNNTNKIVPLFEI
jgi:hypothetical protein